MNKTNYNTIIIGGGAAGFFTAINLAEQTSNHSIAILERGKDVLQKVRISGGGRCNVTHAEFEPKPLSRNYPRGEKELLGPFHSFMTGDTIAWFEERGVELKIEEDGRMFPVSNSSQTIIDCFISLARKHNIDILTSNNVASIEKTDSWKLHTKTDTFSCEHLVVTAGSSPKVWEMMRQLDHTIVNAVPSLFTFNIVDKKIIELAGIAVEARVEIPQLQLESQGPLLITHWGFSGPAILKMSAWGARELHESDYKFDLVVNWLNYISAQDCFETLAARRKDSKKQVGNEWLFDLPKRLWKYLVESISLTEKNWADCSNTDLHNLATVLTASTFAINGKSTFKEEFVTAGGVDLKEVNFKSFSSKKQDNLYLAGEILNIDAITGGFNFQNAWTGGWMIARAIGSRQ
ncbi:aminoacetone oxidase family FAD-binding enzyme [Nonlabens sp. MB-3u-79]|uniref:NAD(P)/FAD-dependent oxidoreductase n=1 Tax=Nonlabens sp. MB-3u-79 TaxID=2058134 RepID=UPI000C30D6AA|nr:NAD(P)/FAD-dependent oxidoreductase [Nonlabens sp. MB-3u-79]AUC78233.1 aminoacetone oxidase family FAD-binding enzyme [Nonlabens sp. MB-3u-79]